MKKAYLWFCGFDQSPQTQAAGMDDHLRNIRNLDQKWWQTAILMANSILLLIIAIGLILFFSVWSPEIALKYKPNFNLTSYVYGREV